MRTMWVHPNFDLSKNIWAIDHGTKGKDVKEAVVNLDCPAE
jgi:hypothetical protein